LIWVFNGFMLDTTSFSVQGNYEGPSGQNAIEITLGHSRDGRMDLKQFVLGLVTNHDGIPLFAKAHSGNASDKNTIMESFLKVKNGLSLDDAAYYIADSAVYSEKKYSTAWNRYTLDYSCTRNSS